MAALSCRADPHPVFAVRRAGLYLPAPVEWIAHSAPRWLAAAIVMALLVIGLAALALIVLPMVPMMVGNRIGLHPVAVIFALLVLGKLFGFFGVLLALPASAALLVARHLRAHYVDRDLYKSQ